MRKHLLSLLVLLLAGFGLARGQSNYDFYHVSGDDTLYFQYTSINTCKLVPPSLYGDWYGYTQPSGRVTIPDTVNYSCLVTEIAPSAFYGCTGITYLYVPPTIASIGESAFQGCSYLNEIYFDSSTSWTLSLDTIGPNAFAGCTRINWVFFCSTLEKWMNVGLGNAASNPMSSVNWSGVCLRGWWGNPPQRIDVPTSIHKIKKYTFYKWNAIRKITMSDTLVTSIGDSAFFGIVHLDSLWIGHGVTHIGAGAFQGCSSLDFVRMGNSVSSIGERAFEGCSSLAALTLPSITSVPNRLCYGCSHLHSIVIPNTVTSIGDYAFYNCSDMASLTLGNHVSSIGSYAFDGCGRLLSVTIPRSVRTIGYAAFRNNSFLSTLNFNSDSCSSVNYSWLDGCNRLTNVNIGNHVKIIPANFVSGRTGLTNIVIPDSVVTIGSSSFSGCTGLTSLTIPNSVVTIGSSSFSGCTGLTSLAIPNSVVTIGSSAFSGCTGLTSLAIPNSVETIGGSAFSGCTGMSTLTIGKAVLSIGDRAFQNCTGLNTVNFNADSCISMCPYSSSSYRAFVGSTNISTLNIGNNVKRIPDYAFMDCSNLGAVNIPDSLKTIGQYAFSGCTGMSTLTIGKAVLSIGDRAFQNCTGLNTVNFNADSCISMCPYSSSSYRAFVGSTNISTLNIGNNVKRIPDYAFMDCSNLGAVNIPDSLKTIGQYAFSGCTGMSTLTIGKAVSSIGDRAFQNCTGLNTVNFNADSCISMCTSLFYSTSFYSYRAFVGSTNISTLNIGNNVKRIPDYAFMGCSNIGSLTIPDSVKTIGQYAFSGCTGMSTLTIGKAVSSIGNYAFQNDTLIATVNFNADSLLTTGVFSGRTNITTLNIGSNVKWISGFTFSGCTGLTSLTIPDSVKTIGQYAFSGCTGLSTLTIGKAVSSIGDYAFQNCSGLYTVNFNADSCISTIYGSHRAFVGCTNISTLNIGNNVKRIPDYAFMDCSNLGSLTIPDSVGTIGQCAFSGCTGLTSLTISNSVVTIGGSAFSGCTGLTSLTIPNSVVTIGSAAFSGCTGLTSVDIPNSVETIGSGAFSNCRSMETLTIGRSVSYIGDYAFHDCTNLSTVNYNADSCVSMYSDNSRWGRESVFEDNDHITSLNIGGNVKIIPDYAFDHCSGLTSLVIPDSVETIGYGAFYGITLDTITIYNSVPPTLGEYVFSNMSHTKVFVPCHAGAAYRTDAQWGQFSQIYEQECRLYDFWAVAPSGDTLYYSIQNSNSVKVVCPYEAGWGNAIRPTGSLIIPPTVMNEGVTYNVTSIGDGAFYLCNSMTEVTIPNTIDSIGEGAFYYCSGLTTVNFNADSCIYAGSSDIIAFYGCTNFSHLNIGSNVKRIPSYAFRGCTHLDTLTIPASISTIGYNAFYGCTGLTTVNFNADSCTNAGYDPIEVMVYVVLGGCPNFTNLNIGDNVKILPSFAFLNCSGLQHVVVPNSVQSIGRMTFRGCTSLNTIEIGSGVSTIDDYAFYSCTNLLEIVSHNPVPPIVANNTFMSVPSYANVYVPCGSVPAYDSVWTYFTNIGDLRVVLSAVANDATMGSVQLLTPPSCSAAAVIEAVPNVGYSFAYWSDGDTSNPRTISMASGDSLSLVAYFVPNQYVLSVFSSNSAWGTVSGSGVYAYSTTATISATPEYGYHFTTWSDGVTDNPCSIIVTRDTMLTAQFDRNQYALTAQCDSTQGTVTGAGTYLFEDTATVTATAAYGYHFTMWSDSVTDNPRSIIVTSDTMLTALFDRNQYTVTAQCDSTQGTVAGAGTYLYEDTATVTATAAYGYHFTMWGDGLTDNPRTIIVTSDTMLSAQFDRNQYTLTIQCDSTQGTVTGSGSYLYEDTATVTATAAYGYHFTMWSDSVTANPRTIIVTRDTMLTALFNRNQYTVTAQCDSTQGTVAGAGTYLYEDTATVTATTAYGYHFTTWSDGVTANPRSIIVTRDTMLTALFDRNQYTLTIQCDSTQGTVTGSGTYLYEDTATVTATAAYGYHFTMWSDGVTANPRSIIVTRDTMLTALFNRNQYTVTAQCDSTQGTVAGAGTYLYEDTATVTATAAYGYHFITWSDGVTANPRTVIVTRDTMLTVLFDRNQYTLTAQCDSTQGSVTGAGTYLYEDTVTVTATAADGYHFTTWSDGVTDNPRSIIVTSDTMLTAQFDRNEYVLTVVCDETQGVATGAGSYLFGDVARVTVTANEGFVFSHWAETGATEVAFDTVINGNVTLTALFDTLYHTLTLTSNNPEWGTVDGGGRYAHGSTATVTATAHEGFRFAGWSDGSEENPRTVVVNADLELMANFAEQTGIVGAEESNVTLFPNPTHGMLHIKADNVVSVEVCTIEGRVVMRVSQTNSIDLSSLPTGVYYIRVESQQGRSVHKVVKQ